MAFSAICPAINEQLVNLAKAESPQLKTSQVGTLRAVMEQYNLFDVEIVPLDRDRSGKIASVQVMRQKRSTLNEIIDGVPGDCVEGPFDVADNFASTYKIDDGFRQPMKYFENDIRELCEGRDSWVTKDIASRLDANRQAINSKLITAIEPLFKRFNCRWIVKGRVRTIRANTNTNSPWVAVLDFGAGNCDNQAVITINGVSHQITLP